MKRTRVLTNRNFPDGKSYEVIEQDHTGQYYWRAEDYSMGTEPVECCFPVDLEFVKDKFKELGREYKNN